MIRKAKQLSSWRIQSAFRYIFYSTQQHPFHKKDVATIWAILEASVFRGCKDKVAVSF